MPGATATPEIELVVEESHGGGGGGEPPPGGFGGDDGDESGKGRRKWNLTPKRYSTAIAIGMVSILMFFMALASAFIVLRRGSTAWVTVHLPRILWLNTLVLLGSSFSLERARSRLSLADLAGFRKLWSLTTALGCLFVLGQFVAWRLLVGQGVYIASNQASSFVAWRLLVGQGVYIASNQACSFFYVFTGAHAAHLLGGLAALLFVLTRNFEKSQISVSTAADIASYYWHFMDGLWVFLLALLYLG